MDRSSDDVSTPELVASTQPAAQESPPKQPGSDAPLPKDLLDASLNFLANSSNEALLGVFGLLAAMTYVILGRLGLLLIGIASGVILHASWEGPSHEKEGEEVRVSKKRRELALEVSKRLLDWSSRPVPAEAGNENEGNALVASEDLSAVDLEYATFRPATAAALRSLTDSVIQDYVK